jgi:hypothetical protein
MTANILEMAMGCDPLGDFRFDGRREHLLGSLPKDLCEHIRARGWNRKPRCGNFLHGGVLLGGNRVFRTTKFKPKYAAFFNSSSTTSGYISLCRAHAAFVNSYVIEQFKPQSELRVISKRLQRRFAGLSESLDDSFRWLFRCSEQLERECQLLF